MATVATQLNSGSGFASGEIVTATKLNNLVNTATVTGIANADIDASASIALSKLATGALPSAITVASANLVDGTIVNADVNASAAIAYGKLNLTNSIVAGDITSGAITASKLSGAQTGSAPIYGCRAWVNFDGSAGSTVDSEFRCTIRGGGNVSKVVRSSTGVFVVHFTTAMPDANYCVQTTAGDSSAEVAMFAASLTTSSVTVTNQINAAYSANNPTFGFVAIFG